MGLDAFEISHSILAMWGVRLFDPSVMRITVSERIGMGEAIVLSSAGQRWCEEAVEAVEAVL